MVGGDWNEPRLSEVNWNEAKSLDELSKLTIGVNPNPQ